MIGTKKQAINYLLNYEDEKKFEVKEYKPKRGLRANAYYWSLLNQLADVLKMSKEEIHLHMLQNYGQSSMWATKIEENPADYFKYYIDCGESVVFGVKMRKVKVYKESSKMDSREFSILLEGLIQECKQQDIPTLDDLEIKEMIKDYEVNHTK